MPAHPEAPRLWRLVTIVCGVLVFALGANELLGLRPRWNPAEVTHPAALAAECWFFLVYGLVLLWPAERASSGRIWRTAFVLTCVCSLLFAAAMISEVMAKNYLAAGKGTKARMPVAQAVMLFLGLGQIPLRLFTRRPELLD
ncbi:MAG: hypothetical protein ACO3ND_00030 [Opitutales bacterium]